MAEELESDPLEVDVLSLGLGQQEQLTCTELETLANIQAELDRLHPAGLEQIDSEQIPTLSQSVEIGSCLESQLNDASLFITEETVESSIMHNDENHLIDPDDYIEEETVETESLDSHTIGPNTDISNLNIIMSENIEQIEVSEESVPETEMIMPEEQRKTQTSFVPIVFQSNPSTSSPQTQMIFNSTGGEFFFQHLPNSSSSTQTGVTSKFVQITPKTVNKPILTTSTMPLTKIPQVTKRSIAPLSSASSSSGKVKQNKLLINNFIYKNKPINVFFVIINIHIP